MSRPMYPMLNPAPIQNKKATNWEALFARFQLNQIAYKKLGLSHSYRRHTASAITYIELCPKPNHVWQAYK